MKHTLFLIPLLFIFFSCQEQKNNVLTSEEKADGWELLFDGSTLNGWRDYNGTSLTAPWVVENGSLAALGKGDDANGYIVTDREFENFILLFDWKIAKGGNSGLLYHVVERPQYSVPYLTGPEFQVIDNENFPERLEDWQMAGADYAMYPADSTKIKLNPAGEWNQSKIVFDNGHVEYWVNAEKVVEFEAWTDEWFALKNSGKWANAPEYGLARKGVISLQDHGDRAWFRNIKIKQLPRKTVNEELFNGKNLDGWEIFGTEKWYVDNGLLVSESSEKKEYGYLATRKYYDNFELSAEFKQEADGNSGIFFRSFIEEETKINGWQVEVAPEGKGTGGIYESYGRGWLAQISQEQELLLKTDEWNSIRIRVNDGSVTTWLNDVQMVEIQDVKIAEAQGRIALQIHDGGGIKVLWRNLNLQEL